MSKLKNKIKQHDAHVKLFRKMFHLTVSLMISFLVLKRYVDFLLEAHVFNEYYLRYVDMK